MRSLIALLLMVFANTGLASQDFHTKLAQQLARECALLLSNPTIQAKIDQVILSAARTYLSEQTVRHPGDRDVIRNLKGLSPEDLRPLTSEGRAYLDKVRAESVDVLKILSEEGASQTVKVDSYIRESSENRKAFDSAVRARRYNEIIEIFDKKLSPEEKSQLKPQQELALALNKRGQGKDRARAIRVLQKLVREFGPDGETLGLMGAVYKARYLLANTESQKELLLAQAINSYALGFENSVGDYYPGLNLINLLFERIGYNRAKLQAGQFSDPLLEPTERRMEIDSDLRIISRNVPVVRKYVEISLRSSKRIILNKKFNMSDHVRANDSQYWAYLTLMQLEVIALDIVSAREAFNNARLLGRPRAWAKSTIDTLQIFGERIYEYSNGKHEGFNKLLEDFKTYVNEPEASR